MSNLDVAVASFWQLARHWKKGDKAKLELSCEGENLHIQLSAVLGHPDQPHFPYPPSSYPPSQFKKKSPSQLRRQERRRQEALEKASATKVAEKDMSDKAVKSASVADQAKEKSFEEEDDIHPTSNNKNMFKCNQCETGFISTGTLDSHMMKEHI